MEVVLGRKEISGLTPGWTLHRLLVLANDWAQSGEGDGVGLWIQGYTGWVACGGQCWRPRLWQGLPAAFLEKRTLWMAVGAKAESSDAAVCE